MIYRWRWRRGIVRWYDCDRKSMYRFRIRIIVFCFVALSCVRNSCKTPLAISFCTCSVWEVKKKKWSEENCGRRESEKVCISLEFNFVHEWSAHERRLWSALRVTKRVIMQALPQHVIEYDNRECSLDSCYATRYDYYELYWPPMNKIIQSRSARCSLEGKKKRKWSR